MTDKEKYDFIDHVVHLTLVEEDRLLDEHGGEYSGLEENCIDSNEYYRIITERVINILKKNNNYMQEESVSEDLEEAAEYLSKIYAGEGSIDPKREGFAFYIGFKNGAKWQKEQMMKDATECEVKVDAGGYPYIDRCIELYDYDKDIPLAKEGDKMKVIIVKDET